MPRVRIQTRIMAPRERVFDLARSIDAHVESAAGTREQAIDGRCSGLIENGEAVTWEARHLGVRQQLKVIITSMDRPDQFVDEMVSGAFRSLRHTHRFVIVTENETVMIDELEFQAPLKPLGWMVEQIFLTRYMRRFLKRRNQVLKNLAESDLGDKYLLDSQRIGPTSL